MLTLQNNQIHELLLNPDLMLYLIITISFYLILKWFVCKLPKSKKILPPGPLRLPILGNLHLLSPLAHRSFQSLSQKYGDVMLFHFSVRPVIIVQSAYAARKIMKTHDLVFADKPNLRKMSQLLYSGKDIAVAPYGEHWRKLKSLCILQLLSNKRVQSFHFLREEEASLLVKKIEAASSSLPRSPVNLSELLMSTTYDMICRAAFGRKYHGEGEDGKNKVPELLKEVLELLANLSVSEFVPGLSWIERVNGFGRRVDKVTREVDDFLEQMIREHENEQQCDPENFIDILLNVSKDNTAGVALDRDNIKGIILDLLAGGTDTSFATLEWAMTELLRHPAVMNNLKNEVRGIMKDKRNITDEDLDNMDYLKAVIKETLRYHVPIPFLAREAREDIKVMGYELSTGTMVMVNAWAIGRDPKSWEEPETFKPERFLNCSIDIKGLDFELIPFGSGRRVCPGIAFAMSNVSLVLANLMRKFEWELPNGLRGEDLDTEEQSGVTIHRKNPLLAVATPWSV